MIKEDLKGSKQFPWPPKLADVMNFHERSKSKPNVVETFLNNLLTPINKLKHRSKILFLSDAIEHLVTGKRTQLLTALSIVLHGLTRNKEIAKFLQNAGIGISPDDIYTLYDTWAFVDYIDNDVHSTNEVHCYWRK